MKNFILIIMLMIATTHSCGEIAEASTPTKVKETAGIFETTNQVTFRVDEFLGGDKIVVKEVTISGHKYVVAAIVAGSTEGGTGIAIIPSLSETLKH